MKTVDPLEARTTAAPASPAVPTSGVRMRLRRAGVTTEMSWDEVGALDWSSFAVVLGAGGMTGGAFETGVLLALQWDHGVPLGDAEMFVGTSAGSVGATLLSLGFAPTDIAAMMMGAEHHLEPRDDELVFPFDIELPGLDMFRLFRTPTPGVVLRSALHLARRRVRPVLLEWMRRGELDPRQFVSAFAGVRWTDHPRLKICTTDSGTGERVVLDASDPGRLIDAVAASCSVPSVMSPVERAGLLLVDGGVWSPTNADVVAAPGGPATVLVLSPMSGSRSATPLGRLSSRFAARRLAEELRQFDPSQSVLVIEPTDRLSVSVIDDALDGHAVAAVLLGAFIAPGRHR